MVKKYILLVALPFLFGACSFLDCDESSDYTSESIFESYSRSRQMVNNIYSYLPNGFCSIDGAMHEAGTDDAVHVYEDSKIQYFVDGTWSPDRTVDGVWSKYYEAIRAANLYLKESEGHTFDEWEYSDKYEDWIKHFENFKYEVRFLRAYYYFELARRYNNIPLVTEVLTVDNANDVVPSSFDTVIDFVAEECSAVAEKLPVTYTSGFTDKEIGRATKGAALALKSRALLYKASPLYSVNDDKGKWKAAAKAAYEIIGNADELGYSLGRYEDLFSQTNNTAPENILVRPVGSTGSFEKANFPIGVQEGKTSTCPTENLVSAYEMTDGQQFDWANPVMRTNPYANRDPRLAMTIAYNGMPWPKNALEIWYGGKNALPLNNATTTGYYLKKYVNRAISFESGSTVTAAYHSWVLFRYAEILLNYAEAMVNAFDDAEYTDAELPISARQAVNMVRARTGVNMPPVESMSKNRFITRLKNERRVELAFEGHRFWDLRRWRDLLKIKEVYGVSVVKGEDNTVTYTRQLIKNQVLNVSMYFYPIPNEEIHKNSNLVQNKGWDLGL